MKRLTSLAIVAALALTAATSDMSAQRSRDNRTQTGQTNNRGNIRHGAGSGHNNTAVRPGAGAQGNIRPGGNKHDFNRPGSGNQGNIRPGGNKPGHDRPDYNRPGNNKPDYNRPGNNRPDYNRPGFTRPGHNVGAVRPGANRPGYNPPAIRPGVSRPPVWNRPYRPGFAPHRPFRRPLPPATWRPTVRLNLWTNILGISVGVSINNAIDRLLYNGYTVNGYNSDCIYLTNVPWGGIYWPDATMYYSGGTFAGSRFYYSTLGYDMGRYRDVYNYLSSIYGAPISMVNTSDGYQATWWGEGNQYITLDFGPQLTDAGTRYFTTLSIGR